MDKICIVKLRKRMGHAPEVLDERQRSEIKDPETGKTTALTLTREQTQDLLSNPRLMSLVNGKFAGYLKTGGRLDAPLVIQFQFASMIPLRLLKSSEVMQMLSISQHTLSKIMREGGLKSYKIGKLRRFLLDDILVYLHDNCELAGLPPDSRANAPNNGFMEQYIQEV
jgi:predicted DNA-binding transcriptional regulator AlpA